MYSNIDFKITNHEHIFVFACEEREKLLGIVNQLLEDKK